MQRQRSAVTHTTMIPAYNHRKTPHEPPASIGGPAFIRDPVFIRPPPRTPPASVRDRAFVCCFFFIPFFLVFSLAVMCVVYGANSYLVIDDLLTLFHRCRHNPTMSSIGCYLSQKQSIIYVHEHVI